MPDNSEHGNKVRTAVRKALYEYKTKNAKLSEEDRFLALLYIAGYKVVEWKEDD